MKYIIFLLFFWNGLIGQTVENLNSHVLITFDSVATATSYNVAINGVVMKTILHDESSSQYFFGRKVDSGGTYDITSYNDSTPIDTVSGAYTWESEFTVSQDTLSVPRGYTLVNENNAILNISPSGGSWTLEQDSTYFIRTGRLVYRIDN